MPIPKEIAIGFKKSTCVLWLNSKGIIPKNVVIEVNTTGLKRVRTECTTASLTATPSSIFRLINTTNSKLSLTTTPESATMPRSDNTERLTPKSKCPKIAPTIP